MSDGASEHPSQEELHAFGLGRLDEELGAQVFDHLQTCGGCRHVVESVPDDTLATLIRSVTEPQSALEAADSAAFSLHSGEDNPLAGHPRYRILELVGVGGMGVVYRAQHLLMDRVVALKVIHRRLLESPAAAERFRREAKAAAGVSHPNIVTAFDADQVGDRHFLVMEYVPGITLSRLVAAQGSLPPAQACNYIRQGALGLQHAHERGMVHRDVKPENLMLTPQGQVKILDFGLARLEQETADNLTADGTVMGSADFLAPEQADDPHLADTRADIYSLGCTLFFLLTGKPPFADGTLMEKLKAHAFREPPPLTTPSPLPEGLERVVRRMLAKDPGSRYQSPEQVAHALEPFVRAKPADSARSPKRRSFRWLAAAAALVILLSAGVAYRVATDRGEIVIESEDPDVEVVVKQGEKTVTIMDGKSKQKVTLHTGDYTLNLAGDGDGLKMDLPSPFVLRRGDRKVVTITRLPPGELRHFAAHTDRVSALALSSDGKTLVSASKDSKIKFWDVATGNECREALDHEDGVHALALSRDGKMLASGGWGANQAKWWDWTTGKLLGTSEGHTKWVHGLAFSADGKSLFTSAERVRRLDLATTQSKDVADFAPHGIWALALDRAGRHLAVATDGDSKVHLWEVLAEKEVTALDVPGKSTYALAFDDAGALLAAGGSRGWLGLWDLSGKQKFLLPGHNQEVEGLAFSRNGKLLVSVSAEWMKPDGKGEIKVWDVTTGKHLADLGSNLRPVFSVVVMPDGKTCFTGHSDGSIHKWRLPQASDDHGQLEISTNDPDVQVVLEQDGKNVAVVDLSQRQSLSLPAGEYTVKAAGKGATVEVVPGRIVLKQGDRVTVTVKRGLALVKRLEAPDRIGDVAFSPDGKFAAMSLGRRDLDLISVWDIGKGMELSRFQGQRHPQDLAFTKDSRQVLVASREGTVRLWDIATQKEIGRFEGHGGEVWGARISPDGRQVLTGCHDKKIRLFDLETGVLKKVLDGHEDAVHCVEFSPDGRRALSASNDKTVRLWDLDKGTQIDVWQLPHSSRRVAWSRDGRRFVIAPNADVEPTTKVVMWEIASKSIVWSAEGHRGAVYSLLLTTDGRFVVSSDGGNSVRFWDVRTGKQVLCHDEGLGEIYGLSLSPDGRWLLTNGGWSKAACLYRLPQSLWPVKSDRAAPANGK